MPPCVETVARLPERTSYELNGELTIAAAYQRGRLAATPQSRRKGASTVTRSLSSCRAQGRVGGLGGMRSDSLASLANGPTGEPKKLAARITGARGSHACACGGGVALFNQ